MLSPEGSFLKLYLPEQNGLIPACLGCLSLTIGEKEIMQALGAEQDFFKVFAAWINKDVWEDTE
jgi:hypothetical protein